MSVYKQEHVKVLKHNKTDQEYIDSVLSLIKKNRQVSRTEITLAVMKSKDGAFRAKILNAVIDTGLVRVETTTTTGRPGTIFVYYPHHEHP